MSRHSARSPSNSSNGDVTPTEASVAHTHVLTVSPSLSVVCFKREMDDGMSGPYFVVREWDAKVIRATKKKMSKPKGPTTEQALRASVRQAILNMNLNLEPANKAEIQYLKSVGILGKRAPSCSLLNVKDILKLLYCFDKKKHAEELKLALGDENNFAPDDPAVMITRVNAKMTPKPIILKATAKNPIDAALYSIRQVEINMPKGTASALVKRAAKDASSGVPPPTASSKKTVSSARKRKAPAGATDKTQGPANPLDMIAGLDALLSALKDKNETDDSHASAGGAESSAMEVDSQQQGKQVVDQHNGTSTGATATVDRAFAVPATKKVKMAHQSPLHSGVSAVVTANSSHALNGMHSPRANVLSPSPISSPTSTAVNLNGAVPASYQSPALGFKRTLSATDLMRTAGGANGERQPLSPSYTSRLPSALLLPLGSPNSPMHTASLNHTNISHSNSSVLANAASASGVTGGLTMPSPSPVGSVNNVTSPLYRNLLSPLPSLSPSPTSHVASSLGLPTMVQAETPVQRQTDTPSDQQWAQLLS